MRTAILRFLGMAVLCAAGTSCMAQQSSPTAPGDRDFFRRHLADYGAQIRGPDRRIDIDAMVERLNELGVTTCYWLIGYGKKDWEDLQLFLPKAAAAKIDVWVYLLPPSESGPQGGGSYSEPFRLDYLRWAEEIAKLSQTHPNLKAWVIDDFHQNLSAFTPEYLGQMQATAKRFNPDFRFLPLMYFDEITPDFVKQYRPVIDGMVVAYPRGRADIDSAWAVLNDVCNRRAGDISIARHTATRAGDYGAASQEATLLDSSKYRVRFEECEQFTGKTTGYQFKQLLIDDAVVWEEDVAEGGPGWREVDVDIARQAKGKSRVKVDFRIYDKKGVGDFPVRWSLRGLRAEGLRLEGFEQPTKWMARHQGPFEVGFGDELKAGDRRFHIPLIVMTAGQQSEFRHRHGEPATPERTGEWVRMCLQAWRDGKCDGVVMYCLDKRPKSAVFPIVQKAFQEFRAQGFPGEFDASGQREQAGSPSRL
jgi:hypothetical protein